MSSRERPEISKEVHEIAQVMEIATKTVYAELSVNESVPSNGELV